MKPLLLVVPLALLAGCRSVGPDYVRPVAPTPLSWRESAPTAATPILDPTWWRLYDDPVLDDLMERALSANQSLKKAVARLDEGRATLRAALAEAEPSATLSPSASRARTSENGRQQPAFPGGAGGPERTQNNWRISLDTGYELDLWGRVRRSLENAEAQFGSLEAATQTVRLTLTAEIAQAYFGLRALDAEGAVLARTVALRRDALATSRARVAGGVALDVEVSRAETELANAESDAIDVRRRRATHERALAVLGGEVPATFRVAARAEALRLPPAVPAGLPAELLLRRPDIAEAERRAAAQSAMIGVTKASFLPQVRLTGAAGWESLELRDLFSWDSRLWSVGPSVSLPVFKAKSNRAELRAAEVRYEQAVAEYRQRALIAFREVEDALGNARAYAEQSAAQARAVAAARTTAESYEQRLRGGMIGALDAVDARRSLLQAERAAVQTLGARYLASVQLIKALGGGWSGREEAVAGRVGSN